MQDANVRLIRELREEIDRLKSMLLSFELVRSVGLLGMHPAGPRNSQHCHPLNTADLHTTRFCRKGLMQLFVTFLIPLVVIFSFDRQQRNISPSLSDEKEGNLSDIVLQNELKVTAGRHAALTDISHLLLDGFHKFDTDFTAKNPSQPLTGRFVMKCWLSDVIKITTPVKLLRRDETSWIL